MMVLEYHWGSRVVALIGLLQLGNPNYFLLHGPCIALKTSIPSGTSKQKCNSKFSFWLKLL